jgi:hypothetical protein
MWRRVGLFAAVGLLAGGSAHGATATAPSNTAPPTISGTTRAGETLTATSGTWSGSTPMTFAYRWLRCNSSGNNCSRISGATTQTYRLSNADAGRTIRISVTATNSDGSSNATSAATGAIERGRAPESTSPPTISGTAKVAQTLSAAAGSWNYGPTSFEYRWLRCNTSGDSCNGVGPNRPAYALDARDAGHTIRVRVRARNDFGSTDATSVQTAVVAPAGPPPVNTAPPVITGTTREGQTLSASVGSWSNSPTRFALQWRRCDPPGDNCADFGSNGQSQKLGGTEIGHTIRVRISATNQYGTTSASSGQTAIVASASGAPVSIAVEQVSPPERLVISAVAFLPRRLTSRSPFLARFRISDTRGNLVRGALVYAIALPYGWVRAAPEAATGADGWATIQLFPTRAMPLRRGAVVFFVRARKPGDSLLAGISTRRLVQVGIG